MAISPHPLFSVEPLEDLGERPQLAPAPRQQPSHDPAVGALMLGLKALSQGAVIAFARLTNLAMVASLFWLFMSIPNPNQSQIIWGGIYAAFILTLGWMVNRGRRP